MNELLDRPTPPRESARGSRPTLKLVSCVFRPDRLDAVKDALHKVNLVGGATLTDVRGFGRQKGATEHYMGVPYSIRFIEKIKLEIVVSSDDLPLVTTLLSELAFTGHVGDGKIFVTEVLTAVRIRTGERGVDAL